MPLPTLKSHALNTGRVAWYLALDATGTGATWPEIVAGRTATVAGPDWQATTQPGGLGRLDSPRVTIPGAAIAPGAMAACSGAAWVHCAGLEPAHSSILGLNSLYVETHTDARLLLIPQVGGTPQYLVTGMYLAADAWTRVAWTYDGSTLKCFFNGALAGSQAITGGALDAPVAQAFLGMQGAGGAQPWIGSMNDVTFWSRALSDVEVADEYTQATNGHPDLLEAAVAPSPPPAGVRSIAVGASGRTLCVHLEHPTTNADVSVSAVSGSPTISVDGGSAVALPTRIWGLTALDNPSTYVLFLLASPIAAGASVTFTASSGWATTSAGAAPACAAVAVANPASGRSYLPAFDDVTPRTMPTGYNVSFPHYFMPVLQYADAMKGSQPWTAGGGVTITLDAEGDLTSVSGGYATRIISRNDTPNGADARGYPSDPEGVWTLKWDGADTNIELSRSGDGTLALSGETLTGAANNTRTYLLTHSTNPAETYYTGVLLRTTAATASNIRVYAPGHPTDGSARWHADFLRILAGTRSIRFMDAVACNSSNVVELADWCGTAERTYGVGPPGRQKSASITAAGPYTDATKGLFRHPTQGSWQPFRITTSPAHGLSTGHVVRFAGVSAGVGVAGGGTYDLEGRTGVIYAIDATHFAVSLYMGTAAPVDTSLTGTAIADLSGAMPIADMVDLCNESGADMWFHVPHMMSDAAVTSAAALIAGSLAAGTTCRVEYSNEHWNLGAHFEQSRYFYILAALAGGGMLPAHAYAKRAAEVHALFLAAFTAAGRASDLVRVFAGQSAFHQDGGPTYEVATWLAANGKALDEFAIAPYVTNGPTWDGSVGWDVEWDAMTIEQVMDAQEVAIRHPEHALVASRHKAQLAARGFPSAVVSCYEGGPEKGQGAGTAAIRRANDRKWARHPRMRGIMLQYLQQFEDDGLALYTDYTATHPIIASGSNHFMWGRYHSTEMLAGKGDGSDAPFDNRTGYDDYHQIVSVIGGAVDAWEALLAPEVTTPATAYTLSGPSGGAAGTPSTIFSLAPNGEYTGTITVTPSGGGLSAPIVKTWAASSVPQTFAITPTSAGTVTLTPTNSGGLANPAARTYAATDTGGSGGSDMTSEEVQAAVVAGIDEWLTLHSWFPADVRRVDPAVLPLDANLVEMLGAAVDPSTAPIAADLVKVKGADFAVEELLARIQVAGTVVDTSPSATSFRLSSAGTSATTGFYVGSVLAFSSGALKGVARRISVYAGSTRSASFATPFPAAPANGDGVVIFGRIDE